MNTLRRAAGWLIVISGLAVLASQALPVV